MYGFRGSMRFGSEFDADPVTQKVAPVPRKDEWCTCGHEFGEHLGPDISCRCGCEMFEVAVIDPLYDGDRQTWIETYYYRVPTNGVVIR